MAEPKPQGETGNRILQGQVMSDRREKRKHWVQSGDYAIEVEIEFVYPAEDPSEPCIEPATAHWLDEIERRAKEGDIAYLRKVGRVFQAVTA
jgi:hypothetical protein